MNAPVVARTRQELDAALAPLRGDGRRVALVPTMGALHDGHVTLMEHARERSDVLVTSIFVNPTQFGPGEDYNVYPRDLKADLARCAEADVAVVFAPEVETMYATWPRPDGVTVDPGLLGGVLEGAVRPTHFRGVLTVVAKLFGFVHPDVAVFGEKDYQQLVLIRQMVRALAMTIAIEGCPTVRERDGLAMSSRNRYLDADQRRVAATLSEALRAGSARSEQGSEAVLGAALEVLDAAADIDVDYLALTDAELAEPEPGSAARLLVAARVGKTRLIDNTGLHLPADATTEDPAATAATRGA